MSLADRNNEAEGLQVVERDDYPEPVSRDNYSKVAPPQGVQGPPEISAYSPVDFDNVHARHQVEQWSRLQESKGLMSCVDEVDKRRKCLSKKSHIWLWGSLLALIVGGVVLGATLGTLLQSSKNDTISDTP